MTELAQVGIALCFNAMDMATGLVGALRQKKLQSYKLRDGLFKKVGFLFCYMLAWTLDTYGVLIGFQVGVSILPIIVLYTCTTEIVSIIENIHAINPELVPEKLKELFHIEG